MKITVKKLSELHKPAHNIRRHSEKQLTEYIRSIEMFGQVKPLVVAEDGEIIAGNGLYEALLRMGRETCDCYVMVGLTGERLHHIPMNAQLDKDAHSAFWFFTATDNRIAGGGPAMAQFASKGHDLFACISGTLRREEDPAVLDRLWNNGVAAFYPGGKSDPKLLLLRLDLLQFVGPFPGIGGQRLLLFQRGADFAHQLGTGQRDGRKIVEVARQLVGIVAVEQELERVRVAAQVLPVEQLFELTLLLCHR